MKKILFLFLFISVLLIFLYFLIVGKTNLSINRFIDKNNKNGVSPSISAKSPTLTPENKSEKTVLLTLNNYDYKIYYEKISGYKIILIPNFDQKKSSRTIIEENNCQTATNGGFYTKENKPLGLFVTGGKEYGILNSDKTLLTGFFYLDENGDPKIDNSYPNNTSTVLQSGPLILNNKPFSTKSDGLARRVVLVEDFNGEIFALSITFKDSQFSGPLLSELPTLVFSIKEPFQVKQALNLDGGSASFFYDHENVYLHEQTSVGSVICGK